MFIVCRLKDAWLVEETIHSVGLSTEYIWVYWSKRKGKYSSYPSSLCLTLILWLTSVPPCATSVWKWSHGIAQHRAEKQKNKTRLLKHINLPNDKYFDEKHAGHDKTANTAGFETAALIPDQNRDILWNHRETHSVKTTHTQRKHKQIHQQIYGRFEWHTSSLVQRCYSLLNWNLIKRQNLAYVLLSIKPQPSLYTTVLTFWSHWV